MLSYREALSYFKYLVCLDILMIIKLCVWLTFQSNMACESALAPKGCKVLWNPVGVPEK